LLVSFELKTNCITLRYINMMTEFTPFLSLGGGILIGLAALGGFLLFGRVIGMTGIVARTLSFDFGEASWRPMFLIGLLLGPLVMAQLMPSPHGFEAPGTIALIVGGLLVGYGTRVGSGCTSGHGICGISRLSKRSIVAVCTFMLTAFITVFVTRHLVGGVL
jgi:uncharacterized membrane protein YedE/YeeE